MCTKNNIGFVVIVLGILATVISFWAMEIRRAPTAAYRIKHDPLTISVQVEGDFSKGHSWCLKVNPQGRAELTIDTYPQKTRQQFEVSKKQLAVLRSALLEESFFDLADEYGERVLDGSTKTITVTVGNLTKTVRLYFLMNWVHDKSIAKLREPRRAVRVLLLILDWFEDPEAADVRPSQRMVLEH